MANKVNIAIGRFQPFTQGHLNMIIEGDAPCIVYRINSSKTDEDTSKIKVKGKVVKKDEIKHAIEYIDNNGEGNLSETEKEIRKADGTLVTYDSKRVRRADSMEYYKTLAVRYLDALGGETKMKSIINETVTKVNTILSHISKLQIEGCDDLNFCEFLNGQALGRIFENVLADKIDKGTPNGFSFKQGTEASFDKDINCESIPRGFALLDDKTDIDIIEYMKEHWSGVGKTDKDFFKLPKYFGIELKTSQSKGATGNKSYANAEHSENAKSKSAFYIIINYDKPSAPNYTVNNVHAYFGFLDQMDWVFYADKSGTAKINNNLLKTRFIQIY